MDITKTYRAILFIFTFGYVIFHLEHIVLLFNDKTRKIIYLDKISLLEHSFTNKYTVLKSMYKSLYAINTLLIVHVISIVLLILLNLLSLGGLFSVMIISIIYLFTLIINFRTFFGGDGGDQMNMIVITVLFISIFFFNIENVKLAGLFFLASQSTLAYLTSGLSKIVSSSWRNGNGILGVLRTDSYSNLSFYNFILSNKYLPIIISWSVIIWECLFPICFLNKIILFIFLSLAFIFHLTCAVIMGLNNFLFAFCSTYPAIIFVFYYI